MVSMEELSVVGKAIMAASVEAELLGLPRVCEWLTMAFDEVAREGSVLRDRVAKEVAAKALDVLDEVVGGS